MSLGTLRVISFSCNYTGLRTCIRLTRVTLFNDLKALTFMVNSIMAFHTGDPPLNMKSTSWYPITAGNNNFISWDTSWQTCLGQEMWVWVELDPATTVIRSHDTHDVQILSYQRWTSNALCSIEPNKKIQWSMCGRTWLFKLIYIYSFFTH